MKLYNVPRNSKIKIVSDASHPPAHRDFNDDEVLLFKHIDGMYSLCYDLENNPVHLAGYTEVEIVEDKS